MVLDLVLIHFFKLQILIGVGKNSIIFGADNSFLVHTDSKKKYILVLGEVPTEHLDDTTIIAKAKYSISFTRSGRKFCSILHYYRSNKNMSFQSKRI